MPVIEREGEVLMEDGTWEPCRLVCVIASAALVEWRGITAWMFNGREGEPDEWRDAR